MLLARYGCRQVVRKEKEDIAYNIESKNSCGISTTPLGNGVGRKGQIKKVLVRFGAGGYQLYEADLSTDLVPYFFYINW